MVYVVRLHIALSFGPGKEGMCLTGIIKKRRRTMNMLMNIGVDMKTYVYIDIYIQND